MPFFSAVDSGRSRMAGGTVPLLVILLIFLGLKISFAPGLGPFSSDGDYYFHLARHVSRGDGLLTSVSLYHQGLKELPQTSTIYPLWPLFLGMVGRVVGLTFAANVLPVILFVVDIVLLYLTTNRLARRISPGAFPIFEREGVTLEPGHLAALVFAASPAFFDATSKPYTEGLAFALALGALLVLDAASSNNKRVWFVLAGFLSGLAYLTRYQMIGFAAAMMLTIILFAFMRRIRASTVSSAAAGFVVAVLPWVIFLAGKAWSAFPQVLIGAHAYRESAIPQFEGAVKFASRWAEVTDRVQGLFVAFDFRSQDSFFSSFGLATLVVPAAAVVLLSRWPKQILIQKSQLGLWTSVISGLVLVALLVPVHLIIGPPRLFGSRHGLVFVFLLIPAIVYLSSIEHKRFRAVLVCLVLISSVWNMAKIVDMPQPIGQGVVGGDRQLLTWLEMRHPQAVVLTTRAQTFAAYSDLRLHWAWPLDPPETTLEMIRQLPIDFMVVEHGEASMPFVRGLTGQVLLPERKFGTPGLEVQLYRINRGALPQAPTAGATPPV